ncbi:Hypothetical protein ORPV_1178 [Orpheovirus IHUMI-LCC2]|uniref:Uncharacterized protein n=1 Tax=Orpheovirus IHUMI-LCC2 TaxID=2023057 RepID=A0A2I2L6A9_9VIRU|nr:Hypothetical protein ORPV_1178 [Orpheovirus IHUMI-LCC2]SNW63082.1 Hypothetical protein ORPV_1178 [Orpheovirus IHUMI-LCC2]
MLKDIMGNEICSRTLYNVPTYYAIVNAITGNDQTGELRISDPRQYVNARPFRTIQAANAAIDRARGLDTRVGQIILQTDVNVNGPLTLTEFLFLRSGDAVGTLNLGIINELRVTGKLQFGKDTRLEAINITAGSIVQNGIGCGARITINGIDIRGDKCTTTTTTTSNIDTDEAFYTVIDGGLSLNNSTIEANSKILIKSEKSQINIKDSIIIDVGEKCFKLNNSNMNLNRCNIKFEGDEFLEETNSKSNILFCNVTIDGDDVILNDIDSSSKAKYENSFININAKEAKDIVDGNKVVYENDNFSGNAKGILKKSTAEYNGIFNSALVSSASQSIIRGAKIYKVKDEDQLLIFKDSENLKVSLPIDTIDGRALTLKFIKVANRKISGKFDRDDIPKINEYNILNLNYLDGVWYVV